MLAVRADTSVFIWPLTAPLAFDDSMGVVSVSSAPLNDTADSGGNEYFPLTPLTLGSYELMYLGCVLLIALCWAAVEELGPGVSLAKEGTVYGLTSCRE
jgi:hypothetical protein